VSDGFDLGKEFIGWGKADVALAEFSTGDDFRLQFVVISEEEVLANRDLSTGADETFPLVGVDTQLARQEDFDASVKEVARCRIVRTESLRLKTCATTIKTRGKHSGVVEDHEVTGTEKVREVTELTICKCAARGGKMKKSRCRTVGEGLLGD